MKEVPLSKGLFAVVDDCDYDRVMQHKWCASVEGRGTKVYAIRWSKRGDPENIPGKRQVKIRMHRWLLGLPRWIKGDPDSLVVDHVDDDGLNNRRDNFRVVTQAQNMKYVEGWCRKRAQEPCL